MTALRYLGGFVVALVALYAFVVNFSTVETSFECPGNFAEADRDVPATLFFRMERYRWWVRLWSDSAGSMRVEIPNETFLYFSELEQIGDQLQIRLNNAPAGLFSTLSKAFSVRTHRGFFEGTCRQISE